MKDFNIIKDMTIEELIGYVNRRRISEIQKLIMLLDFEQIEYTYHTYKGVCFSIWYNHNHYTVIFDKYSYGYNEGLLEMNNWDWDDVLGYLTAVEVFDIIMSDFDFEF